MTLEEARQVMSNPEHPLHKRYAQNDPIITAEVDGAFQQRFGLFEIDVEQIKMEGEEKNG